MKALKFYNYGGPEVLQLEEMAEPEINANELLVRVKACSINYGDLMVRNLKNMTVKDFNMPGLLWIPVKLMFGARKPKVHMLGNEFSGVVQKTGKNVTRFKEGDEVFGYTGQSLGANAQLISVKENITIAQKPVNLDFKQAAVLPYGLITAYNLLKKVDIQPGNNVLIIGASGAIGSGLLQLCKARGATVTGICSTARCDFVSQLGADKVIDYKKEDYLQSEETYDLVLDVLGKGSYGKIRKIMKDRSVYLLASFKLKQLLQSVTAGLFGDKKVKCVMTDDSYKDLEELKEIIENYDLKGIVEKDFPLENAVQAHKYIESGKRGGNVVIRFD